MSDEAIAFIISVIAGIAANYICKWLLPIISASGWTDIYNHSQHIKKPGAATPGFLFVHYVSMRLHISFLHTNYNMLNLQKQIFYIKTLFRNYKFYI